MIFGKLKCGWLLLFSVVFNVGAVSQITPAKALAAYIQLKSISGHEKQAGLYLEQLSRNLGLYTHVFSDSDSTYNFCASLLPFSVNKPSVIFLNHLDVVAANEETLWQHPPFAANIVNDTLYGRGTLDMKGLAIMQLFALKKIKELTDTNALPNNVLVLCVSGEETGGLNGAANFITPPMLKQLKPLVVFGEGGGGITGIVPGKPGKLCFFVSNAEKKSLWIKLEARVKSRGHGSVGGNKTANKLLLRAVNKIENTEQRIVIDRSTKKTFRELGSMMGGMKGFVLKHFDWWIFKPLRRKIVNQNEELRVLVSNSYQLTRMDNPGGPVNQIAQSAAAYYDCRLLPNKSERPLVMKLFFRVIDPRIKITILDESPNAESTKLDQHYGYLEKAILSKFPQANVLPVLFPATTDNSYFRSVNVPVYGLLPFQLNASMVESVHAANEKIPLSALDDGIEIYSQLLKNYIPKKN